MNILPVKTHNLSSGENEIKSRKNSNLSDKDDQHNPNNLKNNSKNRKDEIIHQNMINQPQIDKNTVKLRKINSRLRNVSKRDSFPTDYDFSQKLNAWLDIEGNAGKFLTNN